MIKSYKDLEIYQKAYQLAIEIHKLTMGYPQHETYELGRQLRTASKSIALNIGEGYGRKKSAEEFKHFLTMAMSSCDEVRIQLDFSKDLKYISLEEHAELSEKYEVLGKQIHKLIQTWKTY